MRKLLCCLICLICFGSIVGAIYIKGKFETINYQTLISESLCGFEDAYKEDYVSSDKIDSFESLANQSIEILKVVVSEDAILQSSGIVRKATIVETIKSNETVGTDILIYEPVMFWRKGFVAYISPYTPMKSNNDYYVFLNAAPNPGIENSYIFSSVEFGYFPTTTSINSEQLANNEYFINNLKENTLYNYSEIELDKYKMILHYLNQ